uniref:Glyco_hydro_18 domain-containing protein n=1 Tax=Macrostomum lignano TaxID=282301 RepID=A0A1I8FF25_9PLAT
AKRAVFLSVSASALYCFLVSPSTTWETVTYEYDVTNWLCSSQIICKTSAPANGSITNGSNKDVDSFSTDRWHFMHWDDKQISELISKHYPYLVQSYRKLVNGAGAAIRHRPSGRAAPVGRSVRRHGCGSCFEIRHPLLRPSQLQEAGADSELRL